MCSPQNGVYRCSAAALRIRLAHVKPVEVVSTSSIIASALCRVRVPCAVTVTVTVTVTVARQELSGIRHANRSICAIGLRAEPALCPLWLASSSGSSRAREAKDAASLVLKRFCSRSIRREEAHALGDVG